MSFYSDLVQRGGNNWEEKGKRKKEEAPFICAGVDGTVRFRTTNYDTQGGVYQMTAFGSVLGGTVLNQVENVHNGLGQLTAEYQSQSGAVTTTGPTPTPETQYGYSDPTAGALQTSMTYPNGRILHYGTNGNALDAAIGRIDYLADDNGSGGVGPHLVDYSFMGAGRMVQQADANGVKLTYLQQPGDSSAITTGPQYAGDAVTGLDRFGQVADQNWVNASTGVSTDRFQYGHDQNGNVLYSNNLLNSAFSELYHPNSTTPGDNNNAYDPLNRLDAFARGALSASGNNGGVLDTVSSPSTTQSWNLDAVGNQATVTTNGTTVSNTTNAKNELSATGSHALTFDANGNTTTDEAGNTYTYDSWNHVATVKNAAGATIAVYGYNAGGQRIAEAAGGTTTNLLYDGSQIIEQRQGSTVTDQYVYNIDYTNDVLLRDDNSTSGNLGISGSGLGRRLFPQHDANFNVTALTDASGVVVQRQVYGAYGTMTVLSPSWASATDAYSFNPGYQGMWQDLATGLYYTPNRDYVPSLSEWAQQDPVGFVDGVNLRIFVDDNATSLGDPFGLKGEILDNADVGVAYPPLNTAGWVNRYHVKLTGFYVTNIGNSPTAEDTQAALLSTLSNFNDAVNAINLVGGAAASSKLSDILLAMADTNASKNTAGPDNASPVIKRFADALKQQQGYSFWIRISFDRIENCHFARYHWDDALPYPNIADPRGGGIPGFGGEGGTRQPTRAEVQAEIAKALDGTSKGSLP